MSHPDAPVLDALRGRPVLLVFAPSDRDPAFEEQQQQFEAGSDALAARGIVRGHVLLQGTGRLGEEKVTAEDGEALRRHYDVPGDAFCVLLVGPGGAARWRRTSPVKVQAALDALTDAAEEPLDPEST